MCSCQRCIVTGLTRKQQEHYTLNYNVFNLYTWPCMCPSFILMWYIFCWFQNISCELIPKMHSHRVGLEAAKMCVLQGCESSDFYLISDFFALHKPHFQTFNALKSTSFQAFHLFQTFSHRRSHTPGSKC